MKFAAEVMALLAPYPGREFRMRQIVNYVAPKKADERERKRVQMAVYRVLQALAESGQVIIAERSTNGAPATYSWRVMEQIQNRYTDSLNTVTGSGTFSPSTVASA